MWWDRSLRACGAALILGSTIGLPVSAAPHGSSLEVDIGFFYNDLSPHGRWYEVDDHGWVWSPRVSSGWRPYTVGHWVWTDEYGWLWASDEPYAWAVYHYGRWDWDPALGWVWVPGYDWAPAWVSFRSGGGYVGWAPLSPGVRWEVGVGFRVGAVQFDRYIEPHRYCFVSERSFLDRDVGRRAVPVSRNVTIVNVTQNVTSYNLSGGRVVNRSLSVDRVERATHRAVRRVRAVEVRSVRDARRVDVKADRVEVFRPAVRRQAGRAEQAPPQGKRLGRPLARDDERRDAVATTRDAEERRQLEHQRELEKQREAEKQRKAEHERQLASQRELERQREADRREQEKRIAREREERERQREELERRQAREREAIEARHRQEIRRPPPQAADELDRRHGQEHRAVDERQQRERQQLEAQREQARREREAPSERRTADDRGADKKKKEKERPKEKPPGGR